MFVVGIILAPIGVIGARSSKSDSKKNNFKTLKNTGIVLIAIPLLIIFSFIQTEANSRSFNF